MPRLYERLTSIIERYGSAYRNFGSRAGVYLPRNGTSRLAVIFVLIAVTSARAADFQSDAMKQYRSHLAFDTWMAAPLDGDNASYERLRYQIDKEIGASPSVDVVFKQYYAKYEDDQSPINFYSATYSAFKSLSVESPAKNEAALAFLKAFSDIVIEHKVAVPHTYDFGRIAIFQSAYTGGQNDDADLIGLGKRLMAYDKHDDDLEYNFAFILSLSSKPENQTLAKKYADDLASRLPDRRMASNLLGSVYGHIANTNRNRDDADKAVAALQVCLSLTAGDSWRRPRLEQLIKELHERRALW